MPQSHDIAMNLIISYLVTRDVHIILVIIHLLSPLLFTSSRSEGNFSEARLMSVSNKKAGEVNSCCVARSFG
jgi:hypothetical protein